MRLSLLLAFLFTSTVALAADRQINQISVEQSDSDTIIRLFGSDLIRSPKDRVFFAAEASSYSVEPTMMYGDSEYVEVALGMPVMAGQYRISIGPSENTSNLESMVVIGAIGPQGPAGRDGADGRDGVDGKDGSPGADGQDGMDGADGQDGAKGDPGADGADGSSCSVTQTSSGATLSCTDGTMASIRNGTDGLIGSNGADGVDGQNGENGVDGSSCSVEEIDGGAVVSCTNGTSAVIAGAGTNVVTYPEAIFGEKPPIVIPTGDFVIADGNGVVIYPYEGGPLDRVCYEFFFSDGVTGGSLCNNDQTQEVDFRGGGSAPDFFYLEPDCKGQAFFSAGSTGYWVNPVAENGNTFTLPGARLIAADSTSYTTIIRSATTTFYDPDTEAYPECRNLEVIGDVSLPIEFIVPDFILNAAYPISVIQLP